ncbi:hypothetical protein A2T98_07340 [Nodularia spumigena CENA596]|uniref:Uncharacterized protein n=1 Tax=Nodularia spumigena CENA596 TaxID=1819295 RepID=A0A161UWJ4_NODSP|nr:hypothetical protein A2T98_07340 [Nodularia spumigena CENA596]
MKPHPSPLLSKEREPEWQHFIFCANLMKPHPNPLLIKEREPESSFCALCGSTHINNRTYATIAKNLDLSNRQVAKNAKKT